MRASLGLLLLGLLLGTAGCDTTESESGTPQAGAGGSGAAAGASGSGATAGASGSGATAGASGSGTTAGAGGAAGHESTTAGASGSGGDNAECPALMPTWDTPCGNEGLSCEYFFPLECPQGCSGGDYFKVDCQDGTWVDVMHSAGTPECFCPDGAAGAAGSGAGNTAGARG